MPDAFTVGRFLSATFSTWGRNLGTVIPVVLVLQAPLAFAMFRIYSRLPAMVATASPDPRQFVARVAVAVGISFLLMPLQLVVVTRAGVRRVRGEPVAMGDLLGEAARAYFPALGLVVLSSLATTAAVCTVVGPFFLATAWAASAPALSAERLGPIRALKRSWDLTRGLRWQVFAGFLVVALAMWACACVVQATATALVLGAAAASGGLAGSPETFTRSMGGLQAVNMMVQGILYSVLFTGTAVAYHQLRVATEGPGTTQLERVFE